MTNLKGATMLPHTHLTRVFPYRATLPPEVIDLIIDHLHNDPLTLEACSLVSRNWLSSSRHHLFGSVYIRVTHRRIHCLGEILDSPHNTLSFHLRSLHATGPPHFSSQFWKLLHVFPLLQSLHIHQIKMLRGCEPLHLPSISALTLSSVPFSSYRELETFLASFPALKTLTLHDVSCDHDSSLPLYPPRNLARKLSLDVLKMTPIDGLL